MSSLKEVLKRRLLADRPLLSYCNETPNVRQRPVSFSVA
jgi:hypothetical protein